MKRAALCLAFCLSFAPLVALAAPTIKMKSAVVFIANYNYRGDFTGWGSGFFVDEGIVVTNNHVINAGHTYRVYATGEDEAVNMDCYTTITKSDVRINLTDDVAYMRVYLPCQHGVLAFADDPEDNVSVSVVGYPSRGTVSSSLTLVTTEGVVTGTTTDGWLSTDAHLDKGNSGGPFVDLESKVVGVAVAKEIDSQGQYVTGFFIPSTVIYNGLVYANDSTFGYLNHEDAPSSRRSVSSASASSLSASSSSSAMPQSLSSSSASRSSSRPSKPSAEVVRQGRICERVARLIQKDPTLAKRINVRLVQRFGFGCG